MICDIDFEKITTCIFDVNGVLIDSNGANALAMSRAFGAEGDMQERIVKLYLRLTGVDRGTKIRMVQERIIGKPFEEGEFDLRWERVKALAHSAMSEAPLIPGSREVLEALGRRGRSRMALSNTPEAELREVLAANGLDKLLDVIRGGGDWPKTESLARLLREFELDPRACVFFGDGKGDLQAAGHAGVAFIGIDPGTGEFEGEKNLCGTFENLTGWGSSIGLLEP